jgi:hypothetical protein
VDCFDASTLVPTGPGWKAFDLTVDFAFREVAICITFFVSVPFARSPKSLVFVVLARSRGYFSDHAQ